MFRFRADRPSVRGAALAVVPAVVLVIGLGTGYSIGRADDDQGSHGLNREVSMKTWLTAKAIRDRFPAEQHEGYLRKAIANSRMAGVEKHTGGAFGAIIVDSSGQIVAEGSNHVVANTDPTWHGEMEAIRNACKKLKAIKLDGCILYTSSEPCPMCLATAYWAGLDGIIFGANVEDAKTYGGFDDAFIYDQFTRPAADRSIPQIQMLRGEAVKVWKEYAAQPGNVPY